MQMPPNDSLEYIVEFSTWRTSWHGITAKRQQTVVVVQHCSDNVLWPTTVAGAWRLTGWLGCDHRRSEVGHDAHRLFQYAAHHGRTARVYTHRVNGYTHVGKHLSVHTQTLILFYYAIVIIVKVILHLLVFGIEQSPLTGPQLLILNPK